MFDIPRARGRGERRLAKNWGAKFVFRVRRESWGVVSMKIRLNSNVVLRNKGFVTAKSLEANLISAL